MKFLKIALLAAVVGVGVHGLPAYDDFWFWKLGHMDGPHLDSRALGISRDGKTAVGSNVVVDFKRAWRIDIDWTINTDDGVPPLYNELQVEEDLGIISPAYPSAAYASSDMTYDPVDYDKVNLVLDWGGSSPVGYVDEKKVSYAVQWLLPVLDSVDEGDYVKIQDFGGGLSQMRAKDVSSDGLIMVGYGHNKRGPKAFRADMSDPLLPLVQELTIEDSVTGQKLQSTKAEAVSADGFVIAGTGSLKRGSRGFVTTVIDAATDPITLESTILPVLGGGRFAEASAMTPDGAIIAGRSDSPKGPQACIWFVDEVSLVWVVKGLGSLSEQNFGSAANGIAYRPDEGVGELIVVGHSNTQQEDVPEAFVWAGNPVVEEDEIGYFYDLEYILTKTEVGEESGMGSDWILKDATAISAAGDRIVGWGINPEGGTEAFVVTGYPNGELLFTHE